MSKKCAVCYTENDDEYLFCKNCGAMLQNDNFNSHTYNFPQNGSGNRQSSNPPQDCGTDAFLKKNASPKYTADVYGDGFPRRANGYEGQTQHAEPDNDGSTDGAQFSPAKNPNSTSDERIFGIKESVLRRYIGKNSDEFIRKFRAMETSGSKISWNWPFFLFAFLLGLPFTWFYHRKMYKLGSIMLAVFLALNIIEFGSLIYVLKPMIGFVSTVSDSYIEQYEQNHTIDPDSDNPLDIDFSDEAFVPNENSPEYKQAEKSMLNELKNRLPSLLIIMIAEIAYFAFTIVMSLFADRLYLNHILSDFAEFDKIPDGDPVKQILFEKRSGVGYAASVSLSIALPVILSIIFIITVFTMAIVLL